MTIHEAVFSTVRQPLLTVFFLLMTAQMALLFAAVRDGRSRGVRLGFLLHFLISFVLFYPLMLDICWDINYPNGAAALPAALSAIVSLPVRALVLYEVLTALVLAFALRDLLRFRRDHPTFDSIKETMDLLPAGIAFGKGDGTVVFSNLVMNRLSRALTGKRMTDLTTFRKAMPDRTAENGNTEGQVSLPDGSEVWYISARLPEVDGEPFTQLTATEITEQAAITKELAKKNEKLRDIHMRLVIYNKQAARIVIAQELLTARMTVHNELGSILLESRHYLNEPDTINEAVLLQALKNTNAYLLREYEQDDTARDALADALETAEAIGVNVDICGVPPAEGAKRSLLAAAIAECATNAVKHANGDTLRVSIGEAGERIVFTLQSNGLPPKEEISETGGLKSLRALVEKENGTMKISSRPQVALKITLPR